MYKFISPFLLLPILLFIFSFCKSKSYAQNIKYSTTNNLIVRDKPEKEYIVLLILNKGSKVEILPINGDTKNKEVVSKYEHVLITLQNENGNTNRTIGWVYKSYLEKKYTQTNVIDSISINNATSVNLIPYSGDEKYNPNKSNRFNYRYPQYKGGEKVLIEEQRRYFLGARGGCYYKSKKGTKVYVDKKFCKALKQ